MHSKILSQKQWIVKCSTCLGYLLVHAVIVHRAQGHRLIQKTIEKCIEKSFYMSQLPWRRLSSLHLLSCKNMKNKKIVNNYFLTPDLKHTQSLSLFLCHCLTFMMCCQHKKYTPWSGDAYLGSRYPLKHSSLLHACGYRTRPGMCVYECECARI